MVQVEIGRNEVVFRLEATQKPLAGALKSSVRIPFRNIASVSTEQVKTPWLGGGWHLFGYFGTNLPSVITAGTFWTRQGKAFYYVRDRSKCVTLNLKNHQYKKVVFQVENKKSVALRLKEAMAGI